MKTEKYHVRAYNDITGAWTVIATHYSLGMALQEVKISPEWWAIEIIKRTKETVFERQGKIAP